ncbi:LuxR C-terminal-related transcriptional regulator [Chryseobacterium luquanense]|uniref:LuxR C-terminal-related transcriptional regulator n=1 Tax=Chryseobacterium luquanense TaxID=2983766 RepID=A0ABT3XZ19_9FLAO|nr:LuxR C-terminal-related transcriptional regulator [Chryseobacterium luquanense]MCX8531132.1 LuxR C-terminal-related transcriptional regulator [Chryseobacterium luquanense]
MEKPKKTLYQAATEVWGKAILNDKLYTKNLELTLELHKKLLNIFQAGKYYYMIFNVSQMELEFISPNIKSVLGYEPNEINAFFFLNQIHTDDKPYFLNFENKLTEFLKDLPLEKRGCYKFQHDYRIKTKNNDYVRLLHQIIPIDFDENNYYRSLVLHTDITHIKKEGIPCFSIIGFDDEPSYYNVEITEKLSKSFEIFTKREKEILKCILEGKNSKTIAEELFISLNTVNNHRKNILCKAEVHTSLELLSKSIKEGWI